MKSVRRHSAIRLACAMALVLALALAPLGCGGGAKEPPAEKPPKELEKTRQTESGKPAAPKSEPPRPETPPAEDPGTEEPPAEEPEPPAPAPALEPLAFRFPEGACLAYQLKRRLAVTRGEQAVDKLRVDGTRFLRCTGPRRETAGVVRLEPNPLEEIREGEPVRRESANEAEFLLVRPTGAFVEPGLPKNNDLLAALENPVFPPDPVAVGAGWTVERDVSEGRFVFAYRVTEETDVEGHGCLRIELEAALPGGAPCDGLALDHARARLWFAPAEGLLVKAEGTLAFSRGEGEEALQATGDFSLLFFGRSPLRPDEADEARAALTTYVDVHEMIARKRFSGAEKALETFLQETDVPAYALIMDEMLRRIPDPRSRTVEGLLERSRFDFLKLQWKERSGPPLVLTGTGEMAEGSPRVLEDRIGKPFPDFWWKSLYRGGSLEDLKKEWPGKVWIVHVWMSWVPPCADSVKATEETAKRFADRGVRLLGITLDTEGKDLNAFWKKSGADHPTVWDRANETVGRLGLPGAPAFFVVDGRGVVRFAEVGWFENGTPARLEEAVEAALR